MTIEIGLWVVPLLITITAIASAIVKTPTSKPGGYLPDFGSAIVGGFNFLVAVIVSLLAWLIWALAI